MTKLEQILSDSNVPEELRQQLLRFNALLVERNAVMNLTAITDEAAVARLHFLDSLALTDLLKTELSRDPHLRVIDIGSGAGFPGIPLAAALPEVQFTLLDATQKRVDFLSDVAEALQLQNVTPLCGRAEELCAANENTTVARETFSVATARAVAKLSILAELCLPFVRLGGAFLAMKSADTDTELMEASEALEILGGKLEAVHDYTISGTDVPRRIIVIRKNTETPAQYPRRFARIQKSPL